MLTWTHCNILKLKRLYNKDMNKSRETKHTPQPPLFMDINPLANLVRIFGINPKEPWLVDFERKIAKYSLRAEKPKGSALKCKKGAFK